LDLNNALAIIDLTKPQCPPPRIHKKKGKRLSSPTSQSPQASKRSSKGDEIFEELTKDYCKVRNQLDRMMIKSTTSRSVGNVCPNTGHPRDWVIEAIGIIKTLAGEMALLVRAQCKACVAMIAANTANVFIHMTDACQRDWLLAFLAYDSD
jgi:hypothetical protein